MKKIRMMAPALLLGVLCAACGSKTTEEASAVDSTAAAEVADTMAAVQDEKPAVPDYFSDDLKALGIKGNVAKRSEINASNDKLALMMPRDARVFNEEGKLVTKIKDVKIKRNADGLEYKYTVNESDGTEFVLEVTSFTENNYPAKATQTESGPMGDATTTLTYSDYKLDDHGNWISRKVKAKYVFVDIETEEKSAENHSWTETVSYTYR